MRVFWRLSPRARRLSLRIAPRDHALTVTVPQSCPPAQALAFVHKNTGWIVSRLQRLAQGPSFTADSLITIEDKPYRILHDPTRHGGAWIENDTLVITGDAAFLSRRVMQYLRQYATRALGRDLRAMAQTAGLKPGRLDIRDPTSRWGSCSSTGRIMLSWRLILAPHPVRHYLIAHELSHLAQMNHSPAFWKHVATLTPHRDVAENWLRHHGPLLLRAR